ncbi:MAG TPA: hypothetical protein VMU69_19975 [Bradyrhizobium sp.]|nr:hypothetical protein [Bradyrhizobium sp.]
MNIEQILPLDQLKIARAIELHDVVPKNDLVKMSGGAPIAY